MPEMRSSPVAGFIGATLVRNWRVVDEIIFSWTDCWRERLGRLGADNHDGDFVGLKCLGCLVHVIESNFLHYFFVLLRLSQTFRAGLRLGNHLVKPPETLLRTSFA